MDEGGVVALYAFIMKTPDEELPRVRKRQKELKS